MLHRCERGFPSIAVGVDGEVAGGGAGATTEASGNACNARPERDAPDGTDGDPYVPGMHQCGVHVLPGPTVRTQSHGRRAPRNAVHRIDHVVQRPFSPEIPHAHSLPSAQAKPSRRRHHVGACRSRHRTCAGRGVSSRKHGAHAGHGDGHRFAHQAHGDRDPVADHGAAEGAHRRPGHLVRRATADVPQHRGQFVRQPRQQCRHRERRTARQQRRIGRQPARPGGRRDAGAVEWAPRRHSWPEGPRGRPEFDPLRGDRTGGGAA